CMGRIWLYQLCYLDQALSLVVWLTGSSYPMLVVFALTLGASYGGFVALSPAVLADLFGVARLGTVMGILYTSGGVGALVGPPIAGMIGDHTGSYRWAIAYSLVGAIASWGVLLPLARHTGSPQKTSNPGPSPTEDLRFSRVSARPAE